MPKKQYKVLGIEQKSVDVEKATLEAIFSTSDEDRHGDVVEQNWDLRSYKKNPIILNSHNYDDAQEVIGKAKAVKVVDGKLQGKITFAVEENPKAKVIFDLYAGGFLKAFSVGFMPLEFDKDGKILKSELLEVSAVSVPANARALAKAKGIDVDELEEPQEDKEEENVEESEETTEEAPEVKPEEKQAKKKKPSKEEKVETEQPKAEEEVVPEGTPVEDNKDVPQLQPQFRSISPKQRVANTLSKIVDDEKKRKETRRQKLEKVLHTINSLSKSKKVETRTKSDKAKEKRLINQAIRKLIKEKSNVRTY